MLTSRRHRACAGLWMACILLLCCVNASSHASEVIDTQLSSHSQIRTAFHNPYFGVSNTIDYVGLNFHYGRTVNASEQVNGLYFDNIHMNSGPGGNAPHGAITLNANRPMSVEFDFEFNGDNSARNASPNTGSTVLNTITSEFFYLSRNNAQPSARMTFDGFEANQQLYVQMTGGDSIWNGDLAIQANGSHAGTWHSVADNNISTVSLYGFTTSADANGDLDLYMTVPGGNFAGISALAIAGQGYNPVNAVIDEHGQINAQHSGLSLWMDASQGVMHGSAAASDGQSVSSWTNQADHVTAGSDASQGSSSRRPVFIEDGIAGRSAVMFDGQNDFMSGSVSLPGQKTIFVVMRDTGSQTLCCSGSVYTHSGASDTSNGLETIRPTDATGDDVRLFIDYGGNGSHGPTNIHNQPILASLIYDSNSTAMYLDGAIEELLTAGYGQNAHSFMFGSRAAHKDRYFKGMISEVLIYNYAMGDTERSSIESYLRDKYFASNAIVPLPVALPAAFLAIGLLMARRRIS